MNNNELMHFGIKGMKWGIRRFRNYDGSLTYAGKNRYESLKTKFYRNKVKAVQRDIDSYDPIIKSKGFRDKNGRLIVSEEEARSAQDALRKVRDKAQAKYDKAAANDKRINDDPKAKSKAQIAALIAVGAGTAGLLAMAYNLKVAADIGTTKIEKETIENVARWTVGVAEELDSWETGRRQRMTT